jgi:DNA repair exonuclease SbcCD ATPase subunit
MDEIKRQVGRAQRRLIGQQFLAIVVWSLFATLLIAAAGLAVPKIWALNVPHDIWTYSWLGGGFAAGLVAAAVWTYVVRRSAIEAAIELDRRFGLKERVSSALALNEEERATEVGQALLADTIRRVERIDVREQFPVKPNWRFALPVIPAAVIAGLLLVPNTALENKASANNESSKAVKEALRKEVQKLQQKLAAKKEEKRAESEEELQTDQLLREVAKKMSDLQNKDGLDKKQVQIKINEMAKEIEKRQQELGGAREMRKQLDRLSKVEKGPAEKLADALKEGDFKEAMKQLEQLQQNMKEGKLDDKAKEQLAKQLEQLQQKLQEMAMEQKEAREKLEQEIAKKLAQGDNEGAQKLQEKLDQMNQGGRQAENMLDKLAQKMGQCAECMKQGMQGDPKEAAEKLGDLAKAMKEAQNQLDQLENLDEVLDQLADAKDALNGKAGNGKDAAEGNMQFSNNMNKNGRPGRGMGAGRGAGERPENEVETRTYLSRVDGKTQKGEAVRYGDAGGKNIAGKSKEEIRAELQSAAGKDPDALNEQNLPREQREHAKQYFEKFRKGG